MAQKYCKKPVVIEAMQWGGDWGSAEAILDWSDGGVLAKIGSSGARIVSLQIQTLEGLMFASPGDYIIRGIQGEFYPCKPDIFAATYESP